MTQQTINELVTWLVKRYQRDAFPDNFNSRIDRKALRKIVEKTHEDIKYICIRLNTEDELPLNEPYLVQLMILLDEDPTEPELEKFKNIVNKLTKSLEKNSDITVVDADVFSIDQISIGEFLGLKQLDFDYLSFEES